MIMLFQPKMGWSLVELLGQSAVYGCWGSSAKIRNKEDWRGSHVASLMPKSVLSGGKEEDQLLMA